MATSRTSLCAQAWPVVAAVCLWAAVGCARCDLRGKGFDDDTGSWAKTLRPPADESKFTGTDARSREIERNLGVR